MSNPRRLIKNPENLDFSLKNAAKLWTSAILAVDRHIDRPCRKCLKFHKEAFYAMKAGSVAQDPYRPCRTYKKLYEAERAAVTAYRALGGPLPVKRKK